MLESDVIVGRIAEIIANRGESILDEVGVDEKVCIEIAWEIFNMLEREGVIF